MKPYRPGRVPKYVRDLAEQMLAGSEKPLARLITFVENGRFTSRDIVPSDDDLPRAWTLGITGPPGAGKSTIVAALVRELRTRGYSIGIVAVDPSSAISGGAVLGDRIRMHEHFLDSNVFIRSVATRGSHGGLSASILDIMRLMRAASKDVIIIETAGVGQSEVAIKGMVDTVVAVLTPEGGDSIQLMKAGLIEIADLVVVNKSDRSNAERFAMDVSGVLSIGRKNQWQVSVVNTQAINGTGMDRFYEELEKHRKFLGLQDEHLSRSS